MKRILVVDDVPPICNQIQVALTGMGYDIHVAYDGEKALEIFNSWQPHLVITDLMMPKMHGLDLIQCIRINAVNEEVPVLCISSDDDMEVKREAARLGATGWLTKPFHADSWKATLNQLLEG